MSGALHSQVRYDIRGTYAGGEGKRIYLELFFGSMDGRTIDSTDVKPDGTFVLKGELEEPGCAMVAEKDGFQAVFLDDSLLLSRIQIPLSVMLSVALIRETVFRGKILFGSFSSKKKNIYWLSCALRRIEQAQLLAL